MNVTLSLAELIKKGGVYTGIEGSTPPEVYKNLSEVIPLPSYISKNEFIDALCQREMVLSTAVGNGIAMPHPQTRVIKDADDQKIIVCYLKRPIDMNAPDGMRVFVMFVLMTSNVQTHLQIISALAKSLHRPEVKKALEHEAGIEELIKIIEDKE